MSNSTISVSGVIMAGIAAAIGVSVNFVTDSIREQSKITVQLSANTLAIQAQVDKLYQVNEELEDRLRLVERQMAAFEYREKEKNR